MAPQQPSSARDQVRDIVPALVDLSERVLFGEVWDRPGLSKRDRSLITCATLIALGREKQLVGHLQRALDNGLKQSELSEVIRRLASGDDCRARRQAGVRRPLATARRGRSAPYRLRSSWRGTPRTKWPEHLADGPLTLQYSP